MSRHNGALRSKARQHALYVISEGTARVYRNRLPIADLGPGDVVGEMAFFGNGQRQATATSISRLRGLRINYHDLATVLRQYPALASAIRDVCAARTGWPTERSCGSHLHARSFGRRLDRPRLRNSSATVAASNRRPCTGYVAERSLAERSWAW